MSRNGSSVLAARAMDLYRFALWRLPLAGGLTRLSFNRLANSLCAPLGTSALATMRNGVRIEVDPQDYHGRVLYLFGTNDPKVQSTAAALLEPGDCFLDIGANYSSIGLQVASRVGPAGDVHLFEPQPWLAAKVHAAITRSGLSNVHLHTIGLMDREGELTLARPPHHSGMASFVRGEANAHWLKQTLPVRDISSYVPPLVGSRPFGAKLDIEGGEPAVMPWLLSQRKMKFLIFESAHNQKQLFDGVMAAEMTLFGLSRRVFLKRLERIKRFEDVSRFHDLVAVRLSVQAKVPDVLSPRRLGEFLRT